jgi:hypothetical protein
MTKFTKPFATIAAIVTIVLLPPAAFAKGGGTRTGGAQLAPSHPTKPTPPRLPKFSGTQPPTGGTGSARLDGPVVRDHRGTDTNRTPRPYCGRSHTHTPGGGCETKNTADPIVRDHRSPR